MQKWCAKRVYLFRWLQRYANNYQIYPLPKFLASDQISPVFKGFLVNPWIFNFAVYRERNIKHISSNLLGNTYDYLLNNYVKPFMHSNYYIKSDSVCTKGLCKNLYWKLFLYRNTLQFLIKQIRPKFYSF